LSSSPIYFAASLSYIKVLIILSVFLPKDNLSNWGFERVFFGMGNIGAKPEMSLKEFFINC